jgi:phage tail-like protein
MPSPGPRLYLGGQLAGDGMATPALHQLGVGGARSWLDLLPAVYRKDPARSDFLDRFLRLLQSVEAETAQERHDLARRFDPWTADNATGVLDQLAAWLATVLDERWTEHARRSTVAGAFRSQALRGTPAGLRAAIESRFPHVTVNVTDPAQRAQLWSLDPGAGSCACHDGASGLGFDTMLVAAPAHGAVVGAAAVVDQSTLTGGLDAGAPLFADLAHRFHVAAVPAPGADPQAVEAGLRTVVDAQRPAHTVYTLCVAGPTARVGVQARVGVDAIVAGPAGPLTLDAAPALETAALGAAPGDGPGAGALLGAVRVGQGRLT